MAFPLFLNEIRTVGCYRACEAQHDIAPYLLCFVPRRPAYFFS